MQIEGNVAVVTGAASGLGEATARRLHAQGAEIVLADNALDSSSRQVRVWAELPNPGEKFRPGDSVTLVAYPE